MGIGGGLLTVASRRLWWMPLGFDVSFVYLDFGGGKIAVYVQLRSGLVMYPDKAVRTVQQMAVL